MKDKIIKINEQPVKKGEYYTVCPKTRLTIPVRPIVPCFKVTGKTIEKCCDIDTGIEFKGYPVIMLLAKGGRQVFYRMHGNKFVHEDFIKQRVINMDGDNSKPSASSVSKEKMISLTSIKDTITNKKFITGGIAGGIIGFILSGIIGFNRIVGIAGGFLVAGYAYKKIADKNDKQPEISEEKAINGEDIINRVNSARASQGKAVLTAEKAGLLKNWFNNLTPVQKEIVIQLLIINEQAIEMDEREQIIFINRSLYDLKQKYGVDKVNVIFIEVANRNISLS